MILARLTHFGAVFDTSRDVLSNVPKQKMETADGKRVSGTSAFR